LTLTQKPDPINLPRLLGLGDERRGEEAARHGAEEGASVHYSIT
jgi:hypothetical protein